ncbi:MAG: glycerate kinase [Desulfobacterales bacterium]|nr:glycerate kinase [Desulfobacterales bacterium]
MDSKSEELLRLRNDAQSIFLAGIHAVKSGEAIKRYCWRDGNDLIIGKNRYDLSEFENVYVIGAGKATAAMAHAIEELVGDFISDGVIVVKYLHTVPLTHIRTIEAAHPVPDNNGLFGAKIILEIASAATIKDLVICLISGGGSALIPLPFGGISLEDKQTTIKTLLSCGAAIDEVNAIRKHISMIKGGNLARVIFPATLVTLMVSDVIGDHMDVIASGPTVPDSSTFQYCREIIKKYNLASQLPESVLEHIEKGVSGKISDTPKYGDRVFKNSVNLIIAGNMDALSAAKDRASELGYTPLVLSSVIEGDTTQAALFHTAIAKEVLKTGHPVSAPACILSGGETTVVIKGNGLGGRNQEFSLVSAIEISGSENILILSGGTDGTDGPTDAAGAIADSGTLTRAEKQHLNARDFLENNDSYRFFELLGDLVKTGPTDTNVMDIRIILVTTA